MIKVFCIVGPTGVGKTEVAIELAKQFDLDIISADSRQIYKYMDIGTAKPSSVVRDRVRFHLIDIITPDVLYSAADFARDATKILEGYENSLIIPPSMGGKKREGAPSPNLPHQGGGIIKHRHLPILVGGSGLYLKALFEPFFSAPPRDLKLRRTLEKEPLDKLYERLKTVDPKSAQRIHSSDRQRIVRALELYQMTRKPLSEQIHGPSPEPKFSPYYIGLTLPRKLLNEKINQRFDKMIHPDLACKGGVDDGLVNEVKNLIKLGYSKDLNSLNAIGYQEIIRFLNQEISLMQAIYIAKNRSRQYAKRQMTWFKKVEGIKWIEYTDLKQTIQKVSQYYEKYLKIL